MADFDFSQFEVSGSDGIDALFRREANLVTPSKAHRQRVASIRDLAGFDRVSAETLVHKSDRDLWTITKDGGGKYFIERLFDDNGDPLKG